MPSWVASWYILLFISILRLRRTQGFYCQRLRPSLSLTPAAATTTAASTHHPSSIARRITMAAELPSMGGTLFTYYRDEYVNRVAFQSNKQHKKHVVLIGGLGDGLIPVPYTIALSEALDSIGWSLIQVLLSSSYTGFGHASLTTDCQELSHLLKYLTEVKGSEAIGLVGHSTGCQDAVYFTKEGQHREKLRFIVLQAPVSDRESMAMSSPDTFEEAILLARSLKEAGKEHEFLPRSAMWAPVTAARFLDLATKEGLDDMFSSDLNNEELRERLGLVDVPTLFLYSGADEYVPSTVDVKELAIRSVASLGPTAKETSRYEIVEGAGHAGRGHVRLIVEKIIRFIDDVMS